MLGFLHLLCQLCKDRSEYVRERKSFFSSNRDYYFKTYFQLTFSPSTPGWSHFRLVGLLSSILMLSGTMMAIAFAVGLFSGINTFCFLAAEVRLCSIFVCPTYCNEQHTPFFCRLCYWQSRHSIFSLDTEYFCTTCAMVASLMNVSTEVAFCLF